MILELYQPALVNSFTSTMESKDTSMVGDPKVLGYPDHLDAPAPMQELLEVPHRVLVAISPGLGDASEGLSHGKVTHPERWCPPPMHQSPRGLTESRIIGFVDEGAQDHCVDVSPQTNPFLSRKVQAES